MSYVADFTYDIFISYAQVDNATVGPEEPGWVDQFQKHLEVRLSKRIGRANVLKIWRDERLEGSQFFDQTISDALNGSAVCLSLNSAGYLASDYCRDELKMFHNKAEAEPSGMVVSDRSRIVNCLINNIHYSQWPEEFGRTSGFPFHDSEREEDFGEPSEPGSPLFQKQMRSLVDSLFYLLTDLKTAAEEPETKSEADAAGGKIKLYLADVADSLSSVRRRVITELGDENCEILKPIPPPYEPAAHRQAAIRSIKDADLCIHLLDQFPGREMDDAGNTFPREQLNLSLEYARSQTIWIPRDLKMEQVEEPAYRAALDGLNAEQETDRSYDLIRGSRAEISRDILEKVKELRTPAPEEKPAGKIRAALLDTHLKDQLHALELSRFLLEKHIQTYMVPEEDNPGKNLELFELSLRRTLQQTGLPIILFGNVAEDWVRERLGHAVKFAITHGLPLKECAVYLAPPRKSKVKFELGFLKVHLLDNSDHFNPDTFAPILQGAA